MLWYVYVLVYAYLVAITAGHNSDQADGPTYG